jgi:U3 small nucleolar RNA-associated protein 18
LSCYVWLRYAFSNSLTLSLLLHDITVPKLPIYSANYLGMTSQVAVCGRRNFFYLYDSLAGKLEKIPRIRGRPEKSWETSFASPDGSTLALVGNDGYILLWDVASKSLVADLKINGSVRAIAFSHDGHEVFGSGSDGDVYRWDTRTHKCLERFSNQDGTTTSYMATSCRNHLAVAAESGVVNMYTNINSSPQRVPGMSIVTHKSPTQSLMNLHTPVTHLSFNDDGQIMAFSSRREKSALRLLHVPSGTVFANWPTSKTPLNDVTCTDFSPQSQYMAIGNDHGHCLLYRLLHYKQ